MPVLTLIFRESKGSTQPTHSFTQGTSGWEIIQLPQFPHLCKLKRLIKNGLQVSFNSRSLSSSKINPREKGAAS